jgi:hypothetical protein
MLTPSGDLILSPADAARLVRVVRVGLAELDRRNGGPALETVRLLGEIAQAAQMTVRTSADVRPSTSDSMSGHAVASHGPSRARCTSTDTDWLTVAEAAELAGVSKRHTRRLCLQRDVLATRSATGAWLVDRGSLAARLASP